MTICYSRYLVFRIGFGYRLIGNLGNLDVPIRYEEYGDKLL